MKKILFTLMTVLSTVMSSAQTLVTPPSEGETWHIAGGAFYTYTGNDFMNVTSYIPQTMQVAIDGSDIYIQGLASAYMSTAWVKGTINGNQVTIPSGQFIGHDDTYGNEYLNGQDVNATSDKDPAIDIVFNYDANAGKLSLNSQIVILESSEANSIAATYAYWEGLILTKDEPTVPVAITLPEGVTPLDYYLSGHDDFWDNAISRPANVAFDQDTIYVNSISEELPEAWIKGVLKDGIVTFTANQYLGAYFNSYSYMPENIFFSPDKDITMQYDAATGTLTCAKYTTVDNIGVYDDVSNAVWTKIIDKVATPAKPTIEELEVVRKYDAVSVMIKIPLVDTEGSPIAGSKLTYSFIVENAESQQSPLTFTAALYSDGLDSDMTEIPCTFTDQMGYFQMINDERLIYLMQGIETISTWKRIGLKTTYTGGGEPRSSEVEWYDVQNFFTGISTPKASNFKCQASELYDLQGQKHTSAKKGLYIKNGRKVIIK